jgi:DNA-binding NtrC family response regulator
MSHSMPRAAGSERLDATRPDRSAASTDAIPERDLARFFSPLALDVRGRALDRWGEHRPVDMVGRSAAFLDLQNRLAKVARYQEPVLITGESGVGKEQLAEAIYLLAHPAGRPFVPVNCPQYQEGNLTVSELFGHSRGSFTGAVADRRGAFEEADGGAIFLDEIADLHPTAQAMLLRTLSTGEFRPIGSTRPRSVHVRVISATNRPLNQMMMSEQFRYDLFFRLRHFHLDVPPLRQRDDDWMLILEHQLASLERKHGRRKRFSPSSLRMLSSYRWPGNVRQLVGVVTMGYAMADDDVIEPADFVSLLDRVDQVAEVEENLYERVVRRGEDFWQVVCEPFINRDLNKSQVRAIVTKGYLASGRSYRRLLDTFHLPASDYQKFMDYLRHHDLKPRLDATQNGEPA